MRFLLATEHFKLHGNTYAGFPLLLDDEMRDLQPVSSFLLDVCIAGGRARSRASWKKYGRDMYDFFAFVLRNGLDWKQQPAVGHPSVIEFYRDWSLSECKLDPATINQRLRTVRRFYDWCLRNGFIEKLPYEVIRVHVARRPGMLAHVDRGGTKMEAPRFMLQQLKKPLKFLTLERCKACLLAMANPTHRLLFWLMLATGLRNEEARTFPEEYVFDPKFRKDLAGKPKVRIDLSPTDMKLKGSRPRSIDLPISLLSELWWWSVRERPKRARMAYGDPPASLFVTTQGNAYSESAVESIFNALSTKVSFVVTPRMLRHTYATYTLHGLRERGYKGDPLMYVQQRLGHTSPQTTQIYLHLLEQLDANLVLAHEAEIDALFGAPDGR